MQNEQTLVTSGTAGSWSGGAGRRLSHADQQISEGMQIREGNYNAGSHYGFGINSPVPEHRRRVWAYLRKGQGREVTGDGHIESSVTKNFWDSIRVYYLRLLRLIGHH
jgi:hypothetical protein